MPVVLYGFETWSLTLMEEHRLRVFDNWVSRRIFGPKREFLNFCLYFPHFLTYLGEIGYITSSHSAIALFWVYEYRVSESNTLQSDVNEFLSLLSPYIVQFCVKFILRDNAHNGVEDL